MKGNAFGKHCGKKGEIAQNEQFHLFPQCFLCNLYLKIFYQPYFSCCLQFSLNLGRSQNGVIGNELTVSCFVRQMSLRVNIDYLVNLLTLDTECSRPCWKTVLGTDEIAGK